MITYRFTEDYFPRKLLLNVRAKRWSERIVVRTVIAFEFPSAALPAMKFNEWTADEILSDFGIVDFQCIYQHAPDFQGLTMDNGVVMEAEKRK